jgi:hypothetical protein
MYGRPFRVKLSRNRNYSTPLTDINALYTVL